MAMKVVMVMFDTLNRHMLPCYGSDLAHAPNFQRLAQRTVAFDRSYVCSMPCMPARRELHTARPNFLHRSWGPLEPFDDSMPRMLRQHGVHSHLVTDHYHYFEDGGCTYHTQYTTWEFFRGQEGDPWIGQVADPPMPEAVAAEQRTRSPKWRQDFINRQFMDGREDRQPQAMTMNAGLKFIRRNAAQDNWFLQIETFDPHEPFYTQQKYKDLYKHDYKGKHFDWPPYREVRESPDEVDHCRREYLALLSMCDHYMGQVLDAMDELNLWDDTMLIVCTDHGFLLGEHDCWAKCWMPFYEEISHTPFFVWDPRCRRQAERRQALVQPMLDIGPTVLDVFGIEPARDMLGRNLRDTIDHDASVRDAALFGIHGGHVNVTDGRYVYMRGPASEENGPVCQYTLMPTHMLHMFSPDELKHIEIVGPLSFTKTAQVMRIANNRPWAGRRGKRLETMLFDLHSDPRQTRPLQDSDAEARMIGHLLRLIAEADAPAEQYERLGLQAPVIA